MASLIKQWLSAVELEDLQGDVASMFDDTELVETVTWRYLSEPATGPVNPFTGSVDKDETTESLKAIIGNLRDAQPDAIITGRYRLLVETASFTEGTPRNGDVVSRGNGDVLLVVGIEDDPLEGFVKVVNATKANTP